MCITRIFISKCLTLRYITLFSIFTRDKNYSTRTERVSWRSRRSGRRVTSDYSNCPTYGRDERVLCHMVRAPWRRIGHAPHFARTRLFSRAACVGPNIAPPLCSPRVRFWTWLTIVTTPLHAAPTNLRGCDSRCELIVAQLSARNFRRAHVRFP